MNKVLSLVEVIKAEARRLGFSLAGITTAESPPHLDAYHCWLDAGHHGEMAYLASERALACRADPRQILPECESILVLGLPYPASLPPAGKVEPGRVASYAWGGDYHDVILPRLQALVDFIQAQVGHMVPNRYYTDTGPLLEKEFAQRAGLGWIGKNTCLIHPRLGSYFFLAEILLGLSLPADKPFSVDHCGTCTRCITACPTSCIRSDRTLDASRCISYLTIELKNVLPLELRPSLGDWVFGCDICQQVCPWNRFAASTGDPAFAPRPGQARPDLLAELTLTPETFNRKFRGTPLQRAKRRGYLRNVTVVAANARMVSAVPLLHCLLDDAEPLVCEHAAWALAQIEQV